MIGIFLFDEKEIDKKRDNLLISFIITILIFSIPKTFSIGNIIYNLIINSILLSILLTIIYGSIKLLGSKIKIKEFLDKILFIIAITSIFVFIIIVLFLIINDLSIENILLKASATLITTYYPISLFAYSVALISKLKGWRRLIIGLIALNLYFGFHMILLSLP